MAGYDVAKIKSLVAACKKHRATNSEKGEAMADLVEYMFTAADGIALIKRGLLDVDGSGEIDLVFSNDVFVSQMMTPGITVFIECKNEARKIGATQVRTFASKLNDHNQPLGVMVTAKGLSGGPRTHAHAVVTTELSKGRTIVVLTLDDLALITHSKDLVALVHARRQELEVQRHYSSI